MACRSMGQRGREPPAVEDGPRSRTLEPRGAVSDDRLVRSWSASRRGNLRRRATPTNHLRMARHEARTKCVRTTLTWTAPSSTTSARASLVDTPGALARASRSGSTERSGTRSASSLPTRSWDDSRPRSTRGQRFSPRSSVGSPRSASSSTGTGRTAGAVGSAPVDGSSLLLGPDSGFMSPSTRCVLPAEGGRRPGRPAIARRRQGS